MVKSVSDADLGCRRSTHRSNTWLWKSEGMPGPVSRSRKVISRVLAASSRESFRLSLWLATLPSLCAGCSVRSTSPAKMAVSMNPAFVKREAFWPMFRSTCSVTRSERLLAAVLCRSVTRRHRLAPFRRNKAQNSLSCESIDNATRMDPYQQGLVVAKRKEQRELTFMLSHLKSPKFHSTHMPPMTFTRTRAHTHAHDCKIILRVWQNIACAVGPNSPSLTPSSSTPNHSSSPLLTHIPASPRPRDILTLTRNQTCRMVL